MATVASLFEAEVEASVQYSRVKETMTLIRQAPCVSDRPQGIEANFLGLKISYSSLLFRLCRQYMIGDLSPFY